MKIAIVVNSFPEISETFIINKVLTLAAKSNNIDVIRLNCSGNDELYRLYDFESKKNIRFIDPFLPVSLTTLLTFFFRNPAVSVQSFSLNKKDFYKAIRHRVYLNLFNSNKYDIIHFEYSGIAAGMIGIIEELNAKSVVSCRGSAEKVKLVTEKGRKEKLTKVFDVISAVHCVSDDMKQTIAPYCSDMSKVFVNRPAIDVSFFIPSKAKAENDVIQIITVGRFTFQKGYLPGLMAIKELVAKGYNFVWNIVGDGPQYEEVMFHIHNMQLEKQVNLLGKKNKDELNSLLCSADIFLLTSVYEGIPNVVLEAMAMELPVVATRSGGVDEVITHGVDGFIAEIYNIQQISSFLALLINSKDLRIKLGKQARKKILSDYTLQRQADVYQRQYQSMLS